MGTSSAISENTFGLDKSLKALRTSERLLCDRIDKELKLAILSVTKINLDELNNVKV
jgi:hypothetical protein